MNDHAVSDSKRLLLAGVTAIGATGVGFGIRGGILGDWGSQFGFTQTELGQITGGGLVGFGVVILVGAFFAELVGYGKMLATAVCLHFASAVITLAATPVYSSLSATNPEAARSAAFACLFWGMFLFSVGNGLCEATLNPLVATLFPHARTKYLNILHAGWPIGLVVGGLLSAFLVGHVRWEIQMVLFLIPVVGYGALIFGQHMPRSEARRQGVSYARMAMQLLMPLMLLLLIVHAIQGYTELGTDSWISNITGNILASREQGLFLFVYISLLMAVLRFFAEPLVERISPVGLLLASALVSALGLYLLGNAHGAILLVAAATVFSVGKTFVWPTLLAVASEQFPRGGALVIGAMGGIGMLSAGLLGGPGIGYSQDFFAARFLQHQSPEIYGQYRSESQNGFLFFPSIQGLDGKKVADVRSKPAADRSAAENTVREADLYGGRSALKITAILPLVQAAILAGILIYFMTRGGYRVRKVDEVVSVERTSVQS